MSRYYGTYSQYLGSQRCCNLNTQGSIGPQGPVGPASIGPIGPTGPFGGPTGPTGAAGSGDLSAVLTAGNSATNSIALNNTGVGTNVISLLPNASASNPQITLTDGTTTNTIDKSIYTLTDANAYTSKIKVVPYNSVASTGGQVQIGSGIDTTNNAARLAIAIGTDAGAFNQGNFGIAIGSGAGYGGVGIGQGQNAIAIGADAGVANQAGGAIAIGNDSGGGNQGANSVCLGRQAGRADTTPVGANAVAIGYRAGQLSQVANSICLNATGVALNPAVAGLHIDPIRNVSQSNIIGYDTTSKELTYYTPTTQPNSNNSTAIATTEYVVNNSATYNVNPVMTRFGGDIVAWTFDPFGIANNTQTPAVSTNWFVAIYLTAGSVVSNLGCVIAPTSPATWTCPLTLALYNKTGTRLAVSANIGSWGGGSLQSWAFSSVGSAYTIPTTDFYYLALGTGSSGTLPLIAGFLTNTPSAIYNYTTSTIPITNGNLSRIRCVNGSNGGTANPSSIVSGYSFDFNVVGLIAPLMAIT
jgi:hypothetical protein